MLADLSANTSPIDHRKHMGKSREYPRYVVITPAHNEEAFIEKTLEAMTHQTVLPEKWVIVDDGSMDKTPEIIRSYSARYSWIELIQRPRRMDRTFTGKVHAFNAGYKQMGDLDYDVVGNLDADLSFDSTYIEFILDKFAEDANLGVAGTIFEEEGYSSQRQSFEGSRHVAGGCQLFRKRCFEEIGGFIPNRSGGVDWIAVTTARMRGWKTRSFREKAFFHHRHLGMAEASRISSSFSYGKKDYFLGGHPLWELFRVAYQTTRQPYLMGGLAIAAGYCWSALNRMPRPVSSEFVEFHRKEQMVKLKAILKSLLRYRAVDHFNVQPE